MLGQEGISLDTLRARARLAEAAREVTREASVHATTRPALSATAAGRDLAAQGAALAAALEKLHDAGAARLRAVGEGVAVVDGHVNRVDDVEHDNTAAVRGVPGVPR